MKKVLFALILALPTFAIAQDSIPRVPLIEVFTSSTCGPCKPGNIGIKNAYFDDTTVVSRYTMIKYQMSWPGLGDPYFTAEGGARRSTYGINGVPHLYMNGQVHFQPVTSTTKKELVTEMDRFSYLKITPHIKVSNGGKTIEVDASFNTLQEIQAPASRIFIAIVESRTVKNKKNNGETEFELVFKKMLPSGGEMVIGNLAKDTTISQKTTFTFAGNYRLPLSSRDPIDHSKEHSVEDFNNLSVVVWMQNLQTKEIYNSAWGFDKSDTSHPHHPLNPRNPLGENFGGKLTNSIKVIGNEQYDLKVFPNPSNGTIHVVIPEELEKAEIEVIDITGSMVLNSSYKSNNSNDSVQLHIGKPGLYLVKVKSEGIILIKRIVVE